ncbi:MAG: GHMP kinase [Ignavibacteria bacterium]|nr:GHMP kinase [Ignavibacteria bacterium]
MIITQTPLRISLLGGGTDFRDFYSRNTGQVLSTAIDKYIFIILKERYDDMIYVNYSQKERVNNLRKIRHSLVREAMLKTGVKGGIEITMLADIPSEGSGLGSSSSLTVGLLNAFYMYRGIQVTAEQLAEEASEIEIIKCKKPIGKQDQYIAAYGGFCCFTFQKSGKVDTKKIELTHEEKRIFGSNLLLFYTGKTRNSSDILQEQKDKINKNENIESLLKIKNLVTEGLDSINKRDFNNLGVLINKNWTYKINLSSNISNGEISEMYNKAMKAGALGAKISGAGGGGFLLVYCERENQNKLRRILKNYREMPFLLEEDGSKVIFNYRRYSWK